MQLDPSQKETFEAILNTFLRELTPEETEKLIKELEKYPTLTREQIEQVAKTSCKTFLPDFNVTENALKFMGTLLPDKDKQQGVKTILTSLSSSFGMTLLSQGSFFQPFTQLSYQDKEQFLHYWRQSKFQPLQSLYKLFSTLTWSQTYQRPESDPYLLSPIGYPKQDPVRQLSNDDIENEKKYTPQSNKYDNQYPPRLPILKSENELLYEYDAIIIGSGCGGGVVAAKLAAAGQTVLVIEKGPYIHETEFHLSELGAKQTYERGAHFSTDDNGINLVAGNLIGGGSSINFLVSLNLPHFVREEWAKQGLTYFTSKKFSNDLEIVRERLGITTEGITHHGSNKLLAEGCSILGYHHETAPQNTGGYRHDCHWCFAGCKDGVKNGSMNTWLRDCVEHGGHIIDQTKVIRAIIKDKKAVGVECYLKSSMTGNNESTVREKRIIHAKKVIASGGALQSPGILVRSGLKNKNIGHHLNLHPALSTFGFYNKLIDSFKGPISTEISTVVVNRDGKHNGALIEGMSNLVGSNANNMPWLGSYDHKKSMLKYRYSTSLITIARQKDSAGYLNFDNDPTGESDIMKIYYTLGDFDKQSLKEGIIASAKILVASGAREVRSVQSNVPPFEFNDDEESEINNPRFMKWLELIRTQDIPKPGTPHIMGTCRMGVSPKSSVVKPTGETWEVDNLYVADASLFPNCSGVNPSATIYALALHVADFIIDKEKAKTTS